jgi:pimeloyl-ACP methyl ester carboxylesterase
VQLVLLHGVGTNGRQMSLLVGGPLKRHNIASVALDLPGYGVTRVARGAKVRDVV